MNKPTRFSLLGIFMVAIILTSFLMINKTESVSKPNYLGLANLGLIPTNIQCSHSIETYDSTDVSISNGKDSYLILQSKFGDESCLYKI